MMVKNPIFYIIKYDHKVVYVEILINLILTYVCYTLYQLILWMIGNNHGTRGN